MTEARANDPPQARRCALYVDLDGTLLASDMLWESLLALLSARPSAIVELPGWLRQGKAAFKRRVAEQSSPDPALLPYRQAVVAYLEEARAQGRRVVLATATDERIAQPIADHLGLFDAVLASDGRVNLSGEAKLRAIREDAGGDDFDYVADGAVDAPIWRAAGRAVLAAPSRAAETQIARLGLTAEHVLAAPPVAGPALAAMRPRQWVKNALLFAPLLLAHEMSDGARLVAVTLAFVCFCAVASATYLLNDLLDLADDRQHPRKCRRPFAAGSLPIAVGVKMIAGLFAGGLLIAGLAVSGAFAWMLALYAGITIAYSTWLKQIALVDVFVLAGLYTQRVLAGGVAAEVTVSPWLLAFCLFFFLGLALVKRYAELLAARASGRQQLGRRDYEVGDLSLVETMGLSSSYISVLVLCLFVTSDGVQTLYANPSLLWLIAPIMLYWVTRVWFLARRGTLSDDPVLFATRDLTSWVCGAAVLAVVTGAAI